MLYYGRGFVEPFFQHEFFEYQQQTEIQSPEDEVEVGAVPEAGQKPDDQQVEDLSRHAHAVAAQWDIHVFSEPCAQRDMPSAPELGDTLTDIGIVEVLEELKAEHVAQTARHIRVAGKVKVDLEGISDDADP